MSRNEIQAINRAGEILDLFRPPRSEIGVGDVVREVGLQRTTAHRYLSSMVSAGMLVRRPGGDYALGPLMIRLAAAGIGSESLVDLIRPRLRRLAAETQQTTVMTLWGGDGPVVVAVETDPSQAVSVTVQVGLRLQHDSAQGLLYLAFMHDAHAVDSLLSGQPLAQRQATETDMEKVRRTGLAVVTRRAQGVRIVAAPVFRQGEVAATVAVVGTTAAVSDDTQSELAELVKSVAADVSDGLPTLASVG